MIRRIFEEGSARLKIRANSVEMIIYRLLIYKLGFLIRQKSYANICIKISAWANVRVRTANLVMLAALL